MRRTLTLLGISVVVSLVLGEVAARQLLSRPGWIPFSIAETRGVIRPDPERGHVYAPNLARHFATPDYEIDFRTNSLGLRDIPLASVDALATRVLALGDSYTQGHGVQAKQAWTRRLDERLPRAHVFNSGVSGYGVQQMRRTAEVLFERLSPEVIVIGVYGHGYSRVTDPYVPVGDGAGLVLRSESGRVDVVDDGFLLPVFETPWLRELAFWIDRHWFLGGHVMHALWMPSERQDLATPSASPDRAALTERMRPMLAEIEALQADAARWGTPLIMLLINPVEADGTLALLQREYNAVLSRFARERGLCAVDPLPSFSEAGDGRSLRLGNDPHWSPRAHDLAAARIVEVLRQSLVSPSPETLPCQPAARALLSH
jgi:hypothetical protein